MKNTTTVKLIEGIFTDVEALEILMNIYSSKINFHERKNFSSQVRFGKNDKTAWKRIPELKESMARIRALITSAGLQNKQMEITSNIHISFIES